MPYNIIYAGLNTYDPLYVLLGLIAITLAAPFLWFAGIFIQAKLFSGMHSNIAGTKSKQAQDIRKRIKSARECINQHRMTDDTLMANDGREMVIVRHEPSPSREDAIQWDLFMFTTTNERANWNPATGLDGIPADKLFYVVVNSMTLEYYLMRFDEHNEAQTYFRNLWQSGVKKIEASEFEKVALQGFAQSLGSEAAKKSGDDKKEKEGDNE